MNVPPPCLRRHWAPPQLQRRAVTVSVHGWANETDQHGTARPSDARVSPTMFALLQSHRACSSCRRREKQATEQPGKQTAQLLHTSSTAHERQTRIRSGTDGRRHCPAQRQMKREGARSSVMAALIERREPAQRAPQATRQCGPLLLCVLAAASFCCCCCRPSPWPVAAPRPPGLAGRA